MNAVTLVIETWRQAWPDQLDVARMAQHGYTGVADLRHCMESRASQMPMRDRWRLIDCADGIEIDRGDEWTRLRLVE